MDQKFVIFAKFEEFKQLIVRNSLFDEQSLSDLLTGVEDNDSETQISRIISNIESRDPTDIERFAEVLHQSDLTDEELWAPTDQSDNIITGLNKQLKIRFKDLLSSPKACGEVLTVRKASKMKSTKHGDVYPMTRRPRGFCIVIDNHLFAGTQLPFRSGSRADADRLCTVFSELDFNVLRFTNRTSDEMEELLKRRAQHPDLAEHDALAVIILSHGIKDEIYGTDGITTCVDTILGYFNNKNCPLLRNKPKMFFLSACRGDQIDSGIKNQDVRTFFSARNSLSGASTRSVDHLPTWSDMFVYYSTVTGYVSLRNTTAGSWFGYELAHALAEFAFREHLHDLVTIKVGEKLQQRISQVNGDSATQAIETQTKGGVKKLYFNPGLSVAKETH